MKSLNYKWFFLLLGGFFSLNSFSQNSPLNLSDVDTAVAKVEEEKHITFYKEGLKLLDSLKYEEAIPLFKKSIKKKKDYFEAYLKLGYCKMKLEDYKGAEKEFEKAQETGPNDFETLKLKGINYFLMGNYKESKLCLDTALIAIENEKIDDPEFYFYRAKLMFVGKSYKGALEACAIALETRPKYYDVMKLKCEIRFTAKEYAYALRELNETIKALPEKEQDINLYKMRAKTKFELQDFKGSATDWSVYIDAVNNEEEAYISRSAAYINTGQYSKSIVDLDEAIKLNPKNPVSYCNRGLSKGYNKQIVEGIKDLDYAIKLKFDYAAAYVNRAALKMAAKDKRGACDDLQKADGLGSEIAPQKYDSYCK